MNGRFRLPPTEAFTDRQAPSLRSEIPNLPRAVVNQRFRPVGATTVDDKPVLVFDEHHYARFNGETVASVSNTAPQVVLPESAMLRNMLQLRNASASADIYVSFGANASIYSILKLAAGDQILYDVGVPQDFISAFASAASAFLVIGFSTTPGRTS